ncbi:MAG: hypothetical protein ACJ8AW_53955, partial [Rhodopila sp.]
MIYGWLFFSFVILLLTLLGLPFRQDEPMARTAAPGAVGSGAVGPGMAVDMHWQAFSARSTAGAVMAGRRQMYRLVDTEGRSEAWLQTPDGTPSVWRIMHANDPFGVLAVGVWVDGQPVRPGMRMRARMAADSLLGTS